MVAPAASGVQDWERLFFLICSISVPVKNQGISRVFSVEQMEQIEYY